MYGQDASVAASNPTTETTTAEATKPKKKRKGLKVAIILILILAVLAAAGTAGYMFFFATKTIDLTDCFKVKYSGYNGYATAEVELDQAKLNELVKDESVAKDFVKKAKLEVNNTTNLSNGDEIEVKVSISNSFLENNKLELKSNKIKIKASGIEEFSSMDLSKYIKLKYEGFNKYATAEAELDSSLADEVGKDVFKDLQRQIRLTVKDAEKLENGDNVEVQVEISDKWLKENGLELKSKTVKIEVEGLEDATEVDAFKDMKVNLTGMSPSISLTISNESTDEFLKTVKFSASKSSGLSNGETVKIEATDWDKEIAEKKGLALKETTTEYKIENQAAYVSKTSEISTEVKNQLKSSFIEKAKSKAAETHWYVSEGDKTAGGHYIRNNTDYKYVTVEDYDQDLKLTNTEVVSLYLLTKKDDSYSREINKLVGIVKMTYTSGISGVSYDWYSTVVASNFSIKADGTVSDNAVYEINLDEGKDQESAYQEWVNKEKDDFNVEAVSVN